MQYNLWFLLLGLLAIPFIPLRPMGLVQIFSWFENLKDFSILDPKNNPKETMNSDLFKSTNWMNDFTLSVSRETPSTIGSILCGIWLLGILAMIILVIRSSLRLYTLKKSALPLQSQKVRKLYNNCLSEMNIIKNIPIFSTAFLKSPIIVGLFKPCIYLPIHIISDYNAADMRYMLLHELQHYKYKDAFANYLINFVSVFYWFNPFVWFALKEMRTDREVARDTSVLKMLEEDLYEDYGNALINFAEKVSLSPFPFANGLSGSMEQMQRRINNIANYEKPTLFKKLKGSIIYILTIFFLLAIAPTLSTYAANDDHYYWKAPYANISCIDLATYFGKYKGSFVLYDLGNDTWNIHDMDYATLRVAPNSTYKIYDALFGLEEGVITPENSLMSWNNEEYPFEAWNTDQTLQSAMSNSVNWYFQMIDKQLGVSTLNRYIQKIGYGNKYIKGDLSYYWIESSLKISPVEQIELLLSIYNNSFDFAPENIHAIKDAICLSTSANGAIYGKTGTGRVNGKDINGWFVGYVQTADNTYFFATNIQSDVNATGSNATEITLSILSDMNIWK